MSDTTNPALQTVKPQAGALADAEVHAIHSLPYVRDCLLGYARRPCDDEAAAVVKAIATQIAALAAPAQAAIDAREQGTMASKMEVESWRRSLLVWREASHAELIENTAGLKQCLSNAARLLLDHPSLASRDAAPAPAAAGGVPEECVMQFDAWWKTGGAKKVNAAARERGWQGAAEAAYCAALAQPAPVQQEAAPDNLKLTLMMAPYHLHLVVGRDREQLLSFGRDVWAAAKRGDSPNV